MRQPRSLSWRTARLIHVACVLNSVFVALWLVALLLSAGRLPGGLVSVLAAFVPVALVNIALDCLAVGRIWRGVSELPLPSGTVEASLHTGGLLSPAAKR